MKDIAKVSSSMIRESARVLRELIVFKPLGSSLAVQNGAVHARPVINEPFFVLMSWGAGQRPCDPCQSKDPRAVTELPAHTAGLLSILQNSGLTQYKKTLFIS